MFLPCWRLQERGESFPWQATKWDHPSTILFMGAVVHPESYPGMQ